MLTPINNKWTSRVIITYSSNNENFTPIAKDILIKKGEKNKDTI